MHCRGICGLIVKGLGGDAGVVGKAQLLHTRFGVGDDAHDVLADCRGRWERVGLGVALAGIHRSSEGNRVSRGRALGSADGVEIDLVYPRTRCGVQTSVRDGPGNAQRHIVGPAGGSGNVGDDQVGKVDVGDAQCGDTAGKPGRRGGYLDLLHAIREMVVDRGDGETDRRLARRDGDADRDGRLGRVAAREVDDQRIGGVGVPCDGGCLAGSLV